MGTNSYGTNDSGARADEFAVDVVEEIARANAVDPVDLDPLSGVVDLDALDELLRRSASEVRIEFEYERHTVTVRGDGRVTVE